MILFTPDVQWDSCLTFEGVTGAAIFELHCEKTGLWGF